jgi:hypothetical protein
MSWVEKIKTDYVITCGDGREFRPNWLNATKKVSYNFAEFEFVGLPGTLVKRSLPKGARYGIEIYFQGDDHLDQSEAFQASSADPRPWVVLHPFYGSITVQPTELNIDNQVYNITKITGVVIETITEDNPKTFVDPVDNIALMKEAQDATALAAFDAVPSPADVNTAASTNTKVYAQGTKLPLLAEESESYFNAFNKANAALLTATSEPLQAMRTIQALFNAPALFATNAKARVGTLYAQFQALNLTMATITKRPSKKIYELQGGAILSALCLSASAPLGSDYRNRTDVFEVVDLLASNAVDGDGKPTTGAYPLFLYNLDQLQTANGGDGDSYIPDAQSISDLNKLVNYTVSSLFSIALGARQERSFVCTEDTNIILLTHRFYGLDPEDANLEEMVTNNNICIGEQLQIRKGRRILYYV